jgi:hypothetical protein
MSGWTELPAHIHHRTETLPAFLAAIGAGLVARQPESPLLAPHARFSLT